MNSREISEHIYNWALGRGFTAPYGVLQGEHTTSKGTKYLAVTFGHARSLDATVEIYNRKFIILRTSNNGAEIFNDITPLMVRLEKL